VGGGLTVILFMVLDVTLFSASLGNPLFLIKARMQVRQSGWSYSCY
jgi:hypothetical protein